jgi:hypothetical protein
MNDPKAPHPLQLSPNLSGPLNPSGDSQSAATPLPAAACAAAAAPAAAPRPRLQPEDSGVVGLAPSPDPMPLEMRKYLQQLEVWALANKKDAQRDTLKFWSLKAPAIMAASLSGVLGTLHLPAAIPILIGVIGSICVAFDGIVHPGKMHAFHIRALCDLRTLENSIQNQWDIDRLRHINSGESAAKILEDAEKKRLEISEYLKDAEGSIQETRSGEARA